MAMFRISWEIYLMLGAVKPQILACWADSWQKASYIRDQCLILLILRHGHKTLSIASALLKDLFTHQPQLRVLPSLFICLAGFVQITNSAVSCLFLFAAWGLCLLAYQNWNFFYQIWRFPISFRITCAGLQFLYCLGSIYRMGIVVAVWSWSVR